MVLAAARRVLSSPAFIYLAGGALARAGAIFLIPLYTRRMSVDQYGGYALVTSLLALLPLFLSCGMTATLSKAYFDSSYSSARRIWP